MPTARSCLPLLLLSLLLLPGCLEFDAQEVVLYYDKANDRLDMLFLYQGLHHAGSDIDESKKQLDDAFKTGEFAFWSNWPFKVNPTEVTGPAQALIGHIDVENGSLFTTPEGLLCGYQFVRVNDVQGFFKKLNTLLALGIQTKYLGKKLKPGDHELDDDTRELLTDVLRGRQPLFSLDGTVLRLEIPCSDRDHRWVKRYISDYFLRNYRAELYHQQVKQMEAAGLAKPQPDEALVEIEGKEPTLIQVEAVPPDDVAFPSTNFEALSNASPSYRFFWDNDISFVRQEELTVISLGLSHVEENRVYKATSGDYDTRLLEALRKRGDKIEDSVPYQEIERRFGTFHGRDAKLPPAFAEMRSK